MLFVVDGIERLDSKFVNNETAMLSSLLLYPHTHAYADIMELPPSYETALKQPNAYGGRIGVFK